MSNCDLGNCCDAKKGRFASPAKPGGGVVADAQFTAALAAAHQCLRLKEFAVAFLRERGCLAVARII